MSKVDRRTMMGVAGATIALAACGEGNGANSGGGGSSGDGERGTDRQWGADPHADKPRNPPKQGFNPAYLCVVYMKFSDRNLTIRHGYIASAPKTESMSEEEHEKQQASDAETLLNEFVTEGWRTSRAGHPRKEVNFEKFDFGQQMRIYFFLDNDGIEFDGRRDKNGRYANLLRFMKYRTADNLALFSPEQVDRNDAFFGATLVPLTVGGARRQALRLDNWYARSNGKMVDPKDESTYQYFVMDLQLLWNSADQGAKINRIPIIIDPGGGNMGSQP